MTTNPNPRRLLGLSGALWATLTLVQTLVMTIAISRLHHAPWRGSAKATFLILLLGGLIYLLILAMVYTRIRRDASTHSRAFGWGIGCVTISIAWLIAALVAILSETQSMFVGMLSLAGIFFWPLLFLMGVVLLVARERGGRDKIQG